jgi:photosynthetic reaction center cytochrome c subunit
MKAIAGLIGFIALVLTGFMLFTAGWERPPIETAQSGYRGTGMAEIINPRVDPQRLEAQLAAVPADTPILPDDGGPRARDVYQNVQVLGDLSIGQFNRLMAAMTQWIYPEEGCAGCHNLANLADDSMYQKVVSRRMTQMVQTINTEWEGHVAQTGVTCYTCHRGQAIPQYTWFNADPEIYSADGFAGWRNGQNRPAENAGLSSLPEEPFSDLIEENGQIRVGATTALPYEGVPGVSIQDTEKTYALMMHMSTSLDVNCTYCHNSRHFGSWESSSPQRVIAWHGLNMSEVLNSEYVSPLSSVLPEHRLGPTGEGRKINCETCHQGVNKPLGGMAMAELYPSLSGGSYQSGASLSEQDVEATLAMAAAEAGAEDEPADM